MIESQNDFAFDEKGMKKTARYFKSRDKYNPVLEIPLFRREHSFYQGIRGCEMYYFPTATKDPKQVLFATTLRSSADRMKEEARLAASRTPKPIQKTQLFKMKVDTVQAARVFQAK